MTFYDWIYSIYPADAVIDGRWGTLHICVVLLCITAIVLISLLRNKSETVHTRVIQLLALAIFVLEVTRRVINLSRGETSDLHGYLYHLLPRPWCAISCWFTMTTALTRKKVLYNFSAMNNLLCALVFFAYPSVGFNHKVILFENFYSIATHSLLLISSVSMMTLNLTDFRCEKHELAKTGALLCGVFGYASALILLKIEKDPLYFMPGNEVQAFLGVNYSTFLVIYAVFLCVYFSAFYLVQNIHLPAGKKSLLHH